MSRGAHGACTLCGCTLEECERDGDCPGEIGRYKIPANPVSSFEETERRAKQILDLLSRP